MRTSKRACLLLVACFAVTGMSSANAQSSSRKTTSRPMVNQRNTQQQQRQQPMAKKEMAPGVATTSRAFANGYNVPSTGVAIEGYCPVCYIAAGKAVKGKAEIAHDYQGVTYWFVSDDARKAFAASPEKFLPAYGGWCGVGAAMGQRFPVDPTNFKVVNGRIILFLKNNKVDARGLWDKDEAASLRKADKNWKKMKG